MQGARIQLVPGQEISPTLRLVRELGQGGMGSVWAADHKTLKVQVAVKFLGERAARIPSASQRFSVEAEAAARIKSPHVVQVFDHGVSSGMPYIVMELLEGEDLAARLKRQGRLSPAETVEVIHQLCKALDRAHAMHIVHRDIKPANVFLLAGMEETYVKVLDFGLAKHVTEGISTTTASDAIFGTLHYLSPEQAESARAATTQSDLWSVAVVAYECLTGSLPFEATSVMRFCVALNEGRFTPPTTHRPELPAAADAWFERALRHAPEDRFATARQLASTFTAALAEAPVARGSGSDLVAEPTVTPANHRGWSGSLPPPPGRAARVRWTTAAIALAGALVLLFFAAQPRIAPTASHTAPAPSVSPEKVDPSPAPPEPVVAAPSLPVVTTVPTDSTALAPPSPPPLAAPRPRRPVAAAASTHDLFSDPKN